MTDYGDDTLEIYVDGSSLSGPRTGGVGVRFVWVDIRGDPVHEDVVRPYSYEGGRIGQMELRACIDAIKELMGRRPPADPHGFRKVIIHTDSRYVSENYPNVRWGHWQKNRWITKEGTPVHNKPEWEELLRLDKRLDRDFHIRLEVEWIPGKSDEHTKAVDQMAKKAAKSPLKARKLDHQRVRPKWSPHRARRESVSLHGQDEIIRLITDMPVAGHSRTYHYMYEVVDDGSIHFQAVDYVYSNKMLGAGHLYQVTFNDDTKNPRVLTAVEIEPSTPAGRYIAISCDQKDPLDPERKRRAESDPEPATATPKFDLGQPVMSEGKNGVVLSFAQTHDETFIYKVRWGNAESCDYVIEDDVSAG
jgi:ribonuclease HI